MIKNKGEFKSIQALFNGLQITERIISGANKSQPSLIYSLFRPGVFNEYDSMLDPFLFEIIDNSETKVGTFSHRNSISYQESKRQKSNGSILKSEKSDVQDMSETHKKKSLIDTSQITNEKNKTTSGFYKTGFSKVKSEIQPKTIIHKSEFEKKGIQFKKNEILSNFITEGLETIPEKTEQSVSDITSRPSKLTHLETKYMYQNYTDKRPTYKEIFTKSKDPEKLQIKKKDGTNS